MPYTPYYRHRVWKIEEIGECSLILSSTEQIPRKQGELLPNPGNDFIEKYGKHTYLNFTEKFLVEVKNSLYTPETLILYFDKVPYWAKVGMEVLY